MTDTCGDTLPELFAFEVPTPLGVFRIIGPSELTEDEARKVGATIARLLPLMVVGREPELESETGPCWFCHRDVPADSLIAGYDTLDEQRLACNTCNDAIRWLNEHGHVISRTPAEAVR